MASLLDQVKGTIKKVGNAVTTARGAATAATPATQPVGVKRGGPQLEEILKRRELMINDLKQKGPKATYNYMIYVIGVYNSGSFSLDSKQLMLLPDLIALGNLLSEQSAKNAMIDPTFRKNITDKIAEVNEILRKEGLAPLKTVLAKPAETEKDKFMLVLRDANATANPSQKEMINKIRNEGPEGGLGLLRGTRDALRGDAAMDAKLNRIIPDSKLIIGIMKKVIPFVDEIIANSADEKAKNYFRFVKSEILSTIDSSEKLISEIEAKAKANANAKAANMKAKMNARDKGMLNAIARDKARANAIATQTEKAKFGLVLTDANAAANPSQKGMINQIRLGGPVGGLNLLRGIERALRGQGSMDEKVNQILPDMKLILGIMKKMIPYVDEIIATSPDGVTKDNNRMLKSAILSTIDSSEKLIPEIEEQAKQAKANANARAKANAVAKAAKANANAKAATRKQLVKNVENAKAAEQTAKVAYNAATKKRMEKNAALAALNAPAAAASGPKVGGRRRRASRKMSTRRISRKH